MKRILALSGLILALGSLPFGAFALGLGNIHLHSALGQKLDADIALVSVDRQSASGLQVSLASPEQFDRAGVTRTGVLQSLTFKVVPGPNGYHVHVVSSQPVKEPFLTFLVAAHWPSGQMLRQYTVLLDPPSYSAASAASAAPAGVTRDNSVNSVSEQRAATTTGSFPNRPAASVSAAPVSSMPAAGSNYGPIRRGETLWGIANKLTSGNPAETDQMMVAIYRANPRAFSGNINRMKAGYVLQIPGAASVRAISPREAIAAVKSANERFTARRAAPPSATAGSASNTVAAATGASNETAGTAGVNDGAKVDTAADAGAHLQLVAPDVTDNSDSSGQATPGGNDGAEAVALAAQLKQQLAAANQHAQETADRNAALESQVGDLKQQLTKTKRLVSVQNKKLSQLQSQVRQQQAQAGTSGNATGLDRVIAVVTKPLFLIGLLIVIVLIIAAVVIRRQQQKAAAVKSDKPVAPVVDAAELTSDDNADNAAEATADESEGGVSAADEASDPIAEADFNIDYGLYDQAAEVVRKGIAADPDRDELKLKLFQIYFAGGDAVAFRGAAQEFASDWGADHPAEWNEVSAMGRELVPDEPLFAAGYEKTETAEADLGESKPAVAAELTELAEASDAGAAPTELSTELAAELGVETETATEVATELGVDTMTELESAEPATEETIADPRDEALDFDFDLDEPVASEAEAGLEPEPKIEAKAEEGSLDEAFTPGDETRNESEPDAGADTSSEASPAAEFGLDGLEAELNPAANTSENGEVGNPLLDTQTEFEDAIRELSEFVDTNFPKDMPEEPEPDLAKTDTGDVAENVAPPPTAEPDEDDVFDDDDDVDEMDTKLDLARAYMDMGDPEGARSILEEVIEEGAPDHQEQARTLLDKVG